MTNILHKVTRKTLAKNKTRTVVTIIGVILSAAMITAVTTFISSMQAMLIQSTINKGGPWQAALTDVPYSLARQEEGNGKIDRSGLQHPLGYAPLEGSVNENKPFLYVDELDPSAMELYGLQIVSGRLPQRADELAIPEHTATNGGVEFRVGDTVTLSIGDRYMQGEEDAGPLGQYNGYYPEDVPETFVPREERTYTIVGIIQRPDFENYSAPGFTAISYLDSSALTDDDVVTFAFTAKNARDAAFLPETILAQAGLDESHFDLHDDLLDYMGVGVRTGFNAILYSMGAILIALIMVGSISLIYNAFAISVSERSRQFGMLAGVGATARQIRGAVFFEAGCISLIGIPLGILSGIGGIGVTLYLLRDIFRSFTTSRSDMADFTLSVSVPAVVVAAVVGFATVLISAWIPARRAARVSPIEAIRQTREVAIRGKQVRTSRLTRKLFGIEGDLALKNFKRNRRRYRATVISLVVSIVLFLSASSFSSYMSAGTDGAYTASNYDLTMDLSRFQGDDREQVTEAIRGLDGVTGVSVVRSAAGIVPLSPSLVRPALLEGENPEVLINDNGEAIVFYRAYGVDEEAFRRYVQELGLSENDYTDPAHPRGIVIDQQRYYNRDGVLQLSHLFTSLPSDTVTLYDYSYYNGETSVAEGETGEAALRLMTVADDAPLGVENYTASADTFTVILPEATFEALFARFPANSRGSDVLSLTAEDAGGTEKAIRDPLQGMGYTAASIYNVEEVVQANRNILLVVDVFSYGFIVLITLITVANVFNTISTNVNLRRREFAMLKSVGMTGGGFNRMINFECLFYGLKALLYGLPLSLLVTWLIYKAMNSGLGMAFQIPWLQVVIAVAGVFAIVFITMMYAMAKVRKENIVDALKNENL